MNGPRVLVASPPASAVGGVASYTAALVAAAPALSTFDQWWPTRERATSRAVRTGVHALGVLRWVVALSRRPDLVHLQVTSPGVTRDLLYLRIARRLGVPVVAHLHTSGFTGADATTAGSRALGEIVRDADATIVMSQAAADAVLAATGAPTQRVRVVANPAPTLPEPGPGRAWLPDDATQHCRDGGSENDSAAGVLTVLCVAELSRLKDQLGLLEAAQLVRAEGLDVRLRLVGPRGDLGDDELQRLQSAPGVSVPGVARGPALTREYLAADGYVLFSRSEAEPMSILEAMSCALPVAATAVGSVPTLLSEADSAPADPGLASPAPANPLLGPGDVPALARVLRDWFADPDGRRATGERNRRWVRENRSLSRHLEALTAVYEDVLRAKGRRAPALAPARTAGGVDPESASVSDRDSDDGTDVRISVVIPTVLADVELLVRAVRSALEQSVPPHEVIVVLDRPERASELPTLPVTYLLNHGPHGPAAARNAGVRMAAGELIALLDDDDVWYPDKLERQVSALLREAADVLACRADVVSPAGTWQMPGELPAPGQSLSDFFFAERGLLTATSRGFATPSLLVRRDLLQRMPFDESLTQWEDTDWLLRVSGQGARVSCLPDALLRVELDFAADSQSAGGTAESFQRWADERLRPVDPRAWRDFTLTYVATEQARAGRRRAAVRTVAAAVRTGRCGPRPLVKAISAVALTPQVRSTLAGLSRGSFRSMSSGAGQS